MSTITTRLTVQSPRQLIRLSGKSAKPALQKALTEWKSAYQSARAGPSVSFQRR